MPPEYEGVTFVDLVSTAGMTLRLFSWTRLNGEPVEGTGDARARALVKLVAERCANVKLDPATRAFVESDKPAAQLKDLQTMCAHDDRLA
jgi:hypothetical protein